MRDENLKSMKNKHFTQSLSYSIKRRSMNSKEARATIGDSNFGVQKMFKVISLRSLPIVENCLII